MQGVTSSADSAKIASEQQTAALTKRGLLFRDSLTFLSLTLVTVTLFTFTLFLFHSFSTHRTELGQRWSDRGRTALAQGKPQQAISSLRTALSYAPGERPYELLLAQALAQAGHTDEAFNYYSSLWETEPGSGFINLQLARIAVAKKDQPQAINFYHAALYGTWEGDGVARRRDIRLELARYLLLHKDTAAARAELLVAQGNANDDPALDLELGALFEQAGDRTDALDAYLKSSEADPRNPAPLAAAGRLAYSMGQFATARRLLERAVHREGAPGQHPPTDEADLPQLLSNAERILALFPAPSLSSEQRATPLLALRDLIDKRIDSCAAASTSRSSPQLQELTTRWRAAMKEVTRTSLRHSQPLQDDLLRSLLEAEKQLNELCGPAKGDDALLLLISQHPAEVER